MERRCGTMLSVRFAPRKTRAERARLSASSLTRRRSRTSARLARRSRRRKRRRRAGQAETGRRAKRGRRASRCCQYAVRISTFRSKVCVSIDQLCSTRHVSHSFPATACDPSARHVGSSTQADIPQSSSTAKLLNAVSFLRLGVDSAIGSSVLRGAITGVIVRAIVRVAVVVAAIAVEPTTLAKRQRERRSRPRKE